MNYFSNKTERAQKAVAHTKEMANNYSAEIAQSIANTVIYVANHTFTIKTTGTPTIVNEKLDTVSALFKCCKSQETVTVLNFASYNNPGGKFMEGSSAQEESLCHESFLYNVISTFIDYYDVNHFHKNRGLYSNRALYSPDILFIRGRDVRKANVITCASPNKSLLYKYHAFTEEENYSTLESRIKYICDIIGEHPVDVVILGAFGTGVFKQDIGEVAKLFIKYTANLDVKKIIFAIPDTKTFNEFVAKEK